MAFGLLACTVSAATVRNNNKRHAHHRRNKEPCTTSEISPFPVANYTQPAGSAIPETMSTSNSVVTLTVVPVPITPTQVEPTSQPTVRVSSSAEIAPTAPAGSSCGVATSYVTVQQTITVTAGQVPETTSSSTTPEAVVAPSSLSSSSSSPPPAPVFSTSEEVAPAAPITTTSAAAIPPSSAPPAFLQTGTKETPEPAPTTTTASAPPPAVNSQTPPKPVSGGSYSGKKMGTSWDPNQTFKFSDLGINVGASWVYDWGQQSHGVPDGVEYVPTLHDREKCSGFAAEVASQPGVKYLKHFNEPDMQGNGGSGLSVGEAVALHNQYIAGLGKKYQLGLPAVTSNNIPGQSGTGWLTAFINQVGCDDFSFADFHFYGGTESAEKQAEIFLDYVKSWVQTIDTLCPNKNLPIWISEFSAGPQLGDVSQAISFMAAAGPSLEANPRVARYAYFFPQNTQIAGALGAIVKGF